MKAQVEPGATLPQWDAALQKERDLFQLFPDLAQPVRRTLKNSHRREEGGGALVSCGSLETHATSG
eukprot:SAG11_NODE_1539_length_4722_cov_4.377028_6_plen_66_part_00